MKIKSPRTRKVVLTLSALLVLCAVFATPAAAASSTHIVRYGDTLADIAYRYGTTVAAIMNANGLTDSDFVWTGQQLQIPGSSSSPSTSVRYHTVSWGDTLADIAYRYGTSVSAIMSANGLSSATYITFSSDRNVVAFQLNGSNDSRYLDGLPGLLVD